MNPTKTNRKRNRPLRRREFRCCKICEKEGSIENPNNVSMSSKDSSENPSKKSNGNLIQVCNCNRGACYVHLVCQKEFMTKTGRIRCEDCKSNFRGLNYNYEKRSIVDFMLKDPKGSTSLLTAISLFIGFITSLSALYDTCTNKMDQVISEFSNFSIPQTVDDVKQDVAIVASFNIKFVLPLMSAWALTKHLMMIQNDYREHVKQHFNVNFG